MAHSVRARRWIAALAATVTIGLGTFGLHHLYTDAFGTGDPTHECLTCSVIGSAKALSSAAPVALVFESVVPAPSNPHAEAERTAFVSLHGSRAPPC
jgi:hypothetical protein